LPVKLGLDEDVCMNEKGPIDFHRAEFRLPGTHKMGFSPWGARND